VARFAQIDRDRTWAVLLASKATPSEAVATYEMLAKGLPKD
jgi:hypothetical protein